MKTCKDCIHVDVCMDVAAHYKRVFFDDEYCEHFKDRAKCVDIPGAMSVADLADAYEGIGNALLNVAKRFRGEQADE